MGDVWSEGWSVAAPHYSTAGLRRLLTALRENRPELIQRRTLLPERGGEGDPCVGACLLCYPALTPGVTRYAVALQFQKVILSAEGMCHIDETPRGKVWALARLWDTTERAEAVAKALPLVEAELKRRKEG